MEPGYYTFLNGVEQNVLIEYDEPEVREGENRRK